MIETTSVTPTAQFFIRKIGNTLEEVLQNTQYNVDRDS